MVLDLHVYISYLAFITIDKVMGNDFYVSDMDLLFFILVQKVSVDVVMIYLDELIK